MVKDVNGRFDNYTVSSMIRQVLLQWGRPASYIVSMTAEKKLLAITEIVKKF